MKYLYKNKLIIFPLISFITIFVIFDRLIFPSFLVALLIFLIVYFWNFIKDFFKGIFISTFLFIIFIILFTISFILLFKYHNNGEIARNVNVFDIFFSILKDIF
jgi:hypothetical protein